MEKILSANPMETYMWFSFTLAIIMFLVSIICLKNKDNKNIGIVFLYLTTVFFLNGIRVYVKIIDNTIAKIESQNNYPSFDFFQYSFIALIVIFLLLALYVTIKPIYENKT